MKVAQKLYEGIDIGSETIGLITYMRTDSVRMSPIFINDTLQYIEENYGKKYVGSVKVGKKMKTCRMPMKVLDQLQLIVLRKVLKLTLLLMNINYIVLFIIRLYLV